ncbi:hypothetical protein [Polaribacter porphyrae]|uniref:Lacal_2735 family protein n=1 Tax=Polaribacter porphyrae TaxID=1137780 RepID=A0A2S7WTA0_9FLAO|nr:hypothetical protein [Polaribacter porphyrae]PQJ80794.1 hypothetical protein BTO18_17155 [Polaribacter porphyrae]
MYTINQLDNYKRHLKERYLKLIEKSNDYKFEDEAKSDLAAFKAMKLLEKLNQVSYLNREVTLY